MNSLIFSFLPQKIKCTLERKTNMKPQLPQRRTICSATTKSTSLVFKVSRRAPELISPAKPTPRELKALSDIDDQDGLRIQIPVFLFYKHCPSLMNIDPARVIREALAKTLVHYYPFAGRLREGPNRKLSVDCTSEGVIFIEADADMGLDDFGDYLQPPFPCSGELLFDVPGSGGMLNSPLLLIQVTRLKCGGFIFGLRFNHTMSDGTGITLFMKTIGELARGADTPTILPVWDRHLLTARTPPRVTHLHREFDEVAAHAVTFSQDRMILRSFFFGPTEISVIRKLVPPDICCRSTDFDVLTSFLWRSRTIALRPEPDTDMRVISVVNARRRLKNPPLPRGYYGNVLAWPIATATAKDLSEQPLEFALGLVRKSKLGVTEEYMRSTVDLLVTRGRPHFTAAHTYMVSDLRSLGLRDVDFGWGNAVYGGPVTTWAGDFWELSYYVPFKNKKGDHGIVVPIYLPELAMGRFMEELDRLFGQ